MIRVPTHREPTHPGEMLLEEFLKPMHLSQRDFGRWHSCPLPARERIDQQAPRGNARYCAAIVRTE